MLSRRMGSATVWTMLVLVCMMAWATPALAECQPFQVILSTALSSRINKVGSQVRATLVEAVPLPDGSEVPAGSTLSGIVAGLENSALVHHPGRLRLAFKYAQALKGASFPFVAFVNTSDGWLSQADADTPVWQVASGRSTRMLNNLLLRHLSADRTVWASLLGINSNTLPDPSTDEFIQSYSANDVLLGAGDWLQLKPVCP